MSEFREYVRLKPQELKDQILGLLEGDLDDAKCKRFGALMTMVLLKYTTLKRRKRNGEIKLHTFERYKRIVASSVVIKSREPETVVAFNYFTGGQPELEGEVNDYFSKVKFQINSAKKSSMKDVFERSDMVWDDPKTLKAAGEATSIDESFKNLLSTVSSLRDDILKPVMLRIPSYTRTPATRAEFPLMFLATVFNCCRQSDLTNADPSTFAVVEHEYLGQYVQCLVTETKTRTARFIDFYPVAGEYDPIVALDRLLRDTEPQKKVFTSSFTTSQEYQLLRSNLVGTYDKFLTKTCPFPIFQIKHGPKSHFGRHLMASYLSKCSLGQYVTPLGNWSDRDDTIGSFIAKYGHRRRELPSYLYATAKRKYGHRRRELPSYLYAFLSGYYELIKVESNNGKEDYSCRLVHPDFKPIVVKQSGDCEGLSIECYREWKQIIDSDVLSFILKYSEAKRRRGPLEAGMRSIITGPSPPSAPLQTENWP
ncbi:hypothetical protein HG536_0G04960 [Torulaspora globosa]|uniref:Tyr recombinase Flp-type domain-containing protein n=1 Tax=Torulaspora globosa TaxID=48254 RepID=A0A7G3ZM97_9SACH|nr:uncharacterized protein HG536_0G04960 [Torulaspora globosa]QLL34633.1 hypothetical protein HG536_0G04960 [Torulaspora globosa]